MAATVSAAIVWEFNILKYPAQLGSLAFFIALRFVSVRAANIGRHILWPYTNQIRVLESHKSDSAAHKLRA